MKIKVSYTNSRGYWDNGLLMHAFEGRLYPSNIEFEEIVHNSTSDFDLPEEGGVVVIAGRWLNNPDSLSALKAAVDKMRWCLLLVPGDEEGKFPCELFTAPNVKVWMQTPNPRTAGHFDRPFLLGFPYDTITWLSNRERKPLKDRRYLWSFSGQINHEYRRDMYSELNVRPKGEKQFLHETPGFGTGIETEKYLDLLLNTKVAICPSGPFTPDTFRLYEALEAGCLPIVQEDAPNNRSANYWDVADPGCPIRTVRRWYEIHYLLDFYRDNPIALQKEANKVQAWWQGYKRQFVRNLESDIETLSGVKFDKSSVKIIMPTSVIPAHPDTEIIEDAVGRLRAYDGLKSSEILISVDGLRYEQSDRAEDYEEYKRRLLDLCNWDVRFRNCQTIVFDDFRHQSGMLEKVLPSVEEPLVFFVEHDTFPLGDIPFERLIQAALDPEIDYLRLSIFDSILPEHEYLYHGGVVEISGIPLRRTSQYSARPHFAKTEWFLKTLRRHIPEGSLVFFEDYVWGHFQSEGKTCKGLYIYHPDGGLLRSGTSDGRKTDPKYPQLFEGRWLN